MPVKEQLISIFLKRPKLYSLLLFGAAIIFWILIIDVFQQNLIQAYAIDDARILAQTVSSFRKLYASEVVAKVNGRTSLEITHLFKDNPNGIPLPASFTYLVGEEMAKLVKGLDIQLYSPYPFPWRKSTSGITEDFRAKAWEAFQQKGVTSFSQFVSEGGMNYVRYAIPDVMSEACIKCHNSHPDSLKRDWKVGDIRGVLEVKRPVLSIGSQNVGLMNTALLVLGLATIVFLTIFYNLVNLLHQTIQKIDAKNSLIQAQQQELAISSKLSAVGEMAGGIAHEINTPLGVLKLFIGQLKRELSGNPDLTRIESVIGRMDLTTDRIAGIVKGMRTLARDASLDKMAIVSVKELIEDVANISKAKFLHKSIMFTVKEIDPEIKVNCRASEIGQVLLNLFSNAYDAVELLPEKWVEIAVSANQQNVIITLTDSGSGISKDIADKMFNPFYTTKDVGKGTGIGLTISARIMRSHNGVIELNSECVNTQFRLILPKA